MNQNTVMFPENKTDHLMSKKFINSPRTVTATPIWTCDDWVMQRENIEFIKSCESKLQRLVRWLSE